MIFFNFYLPFTSRHDLPLNIYNFLSTSQKSCKLYVLKDMNLDLLKYYSNSQLFLRIMKSSKQYLVKIKTNYWRIIHNSISIFSNILDFKLSYIRAGCLIFILSIVFNINIFHIFMQSVETCKANHHMF